MSLMFGCLYSHAGFLPSSLLTHPGLCCSLEEYTRMVVKNKSWVLCFLVDNYYQFTLAEKWLHKLISSSLFLSTHLKIVGAFLKLPLNVNYYTGFYSFSKRDNILCSFCFFSIWAPYLILTNSIKKF